MQRHQHAICLLLTLFTLFPLASIATTLQPKTRVIQIEMIIFERTHVPNPVWRYWHFTPPPTNQTKSLPISNISSAMPSSQLNQTVSPNHFYLNYIARRLAYLKDYTVLAHFAWREKISERQTITTLLPPTNTTTTNQIPPTDSGYFKLTIAQYLNVTLAINWQALLNTLPNTLQKAINNDPRYANQSSIYFYLKQSRRMRYDELNYFDNPLFGVLLKIIPIKTLPIKSSPQHDKMPPTHSIFLKAAPSQ